MKKKLFAIIAALAVFALAFTGCPKGDGGGDPEPEPNPDNNAKNTSLSELIIGTNKANGRSATAKADSSQITDFTDINISDGGKATVKYTPGASFRGTAKIVKIAKDATISDAAFASATEYPYNFSGAWPEMESFTDEDKIFVQMTSGDRSTVMCYGFKVLIGWNAELRETDGVVFAIEIQSKEYPAEKIGTPKGTLAELNALTADEIGKMQFNVREPVGGFKVTAYPADDNATVNLSTDGTTWTALANGGNINVTEGSYLYIRVTSSNGKKELYYKLALVPQRAVDIPYGTPANLTITNGEAAATEWNSATDWLYINRVNTTEGQGILNMPEDTTRSHGRAKLMWDEDGIWVYAQVWEQTVSQTGSTYEQSSVELFINEAYNKMLTDSAMFPNGVSGTVAASANQNGGQYRLGANGGRTGPQANQTDAFNALDQSNAVKYAAGGMPQSYQTTQVTSGYVLVYQAPWLFFDKYELGDNVKIAIELQINATGDNGNRIGVLNWNNENSNSYTSLADYGEATLKLNGNTLGAARPTITTQPQGAIVSEGDSVTLTVDATVKNGDLTYEWFKTDTAAGTGTTAGTGKSITITAGAETAYYYAIVTNTLNGTSRTAKSNVAAIVVLSGESNLPERWIDKVEIDATSAPVYGFNIGHEI